jgi:predicted Zn finger-like uncharacterized protein
MRLTCPNCDAQYEVDDSAIPDTGRDVQCSNCGHAWFQLPPDIEAALEAEEAVYGAPAGAAPARSRPAAQPDPDADADEDEDEGDLPPVAAAAAAGAPSPRRALDENLMAILREEAEREAAARQAERARTIETQPDLGIGAPPPLPRPAASPPAQTRPPATDSEGDASPARAPSRRELLPNIDEINSTLNPVDPPSVEVISEAIAEARQRSGFRTGFVSMVVIAAILMALYVMAPRIAHNLPASAPAMQAYVGAVDGARLWLDGVVGQLVTALRGLSGTS